MPARDWIDLTVTQIDAPAPAIRSLVLQRADGQMLPAWQPGAHLRVQLPNGCDRAYSLVALTADPAEMRAPRRYRLAVRLEPQSQGGSVHMHRLRPGDTVTVSPPRNDFALADSEGEAVLLAGGIGITPITAMAAHLAAQGRGFRLHYLARSTEDMAFLAELQSLAGKNLIPHADDRQGLFDLPALMRGLTEAQKLYLCGPRPLIDLAIAQADTLGWAEGRLHFELFAAVAPQTGDQPFELVLQASGRTLTIPANRSIVNAMIEAGLDPLYDCRRGDCGICQATVLEGIPDHRDTVLTAAERGAGRLIQTCVSRSRTPRLVLDL